MENRHTYLKITAYCNHTSYGMIDIHIYIFSMWFSRSISRRGWELWLIREICTQTAINVTFIPTKEFPFYVILSYDSLCYCVPELKCVKRTRFQIVRYTHFYYLLILIKKTMLVSLTKLKSMYETYIVICNLYLCASPSIYPNIFRQRYLRCWSNKKNIYKQLWWVSHRTWHSCYQKSATFSYF